MRSSPRLLNGFLTSTTCRTTRSPRSVVNQSAANTRQPVAVMERITGYVFNNKRLALESLNHGGLPIHYGGTYQYLPRNERLAIVGDGVLDMVLRSGWYHAHDIGGSPLPSGKWDTTRTDLVSNRRLAVRGFQTGLDVCVIKDTGTANVSTDMMATTLEAIIGAVFVDTGTNNLEGARLVMERLGFFHELFPR